MRCQKDNQRKMRDTSLRIAKCALALLFGLISLGLCRAEEEERLFVNGVIWTANSKQPHAEAVLVRGELIHFVGSRAESAALAGDNVAVIDLKDGMLLPGFVENHMHHGMIGLLASKLQIIGTRPVDEVQSALADYAAANPDAKLLFGFGFPSDLNTALNAERVTGCIRLALGATKDKPLPPAN